MKWLSNFVEGTIIEAIEMQIGKLILTAHWINDYLNKC